MFPSTLHAISAAVQQSTQPPATTRLSRSPFPLPLQLTLSQKRGGNVMPAKHEEMK